LRLLGLDEIAQLLKLNYYDIFYLKKIGCKAKLEAIQRTIFKLLI